MDPWEEFTQHIVQEGAERGIVFTPQEIAQIWEQSQAGGFTADATVAAIDDMFGDGYEDAEEDWEPEDEPHPVRDVIQEFMHPVAEEATHRIGRPLTMGEHRAVFAETLAQAKLGHLDADKVAADSGVKPWGEMTRGEINQVMADRMRDLDPEPDDSDRVYDLDNKRDWLDYATARMQGVEFDDTGVEDFG